MNKNSFSLIYFLSRASILGILYSTIFKIASVDAIFCCIIGTLFGCIIIFLINKKSLNTNFHIIEIISCILFILTSLFIIDNFINSFYLTNTPKIFIVIPIIALCLYASFKSFDTLKKLGLIMLFFSLIFIIMISLSLINITDISNISPLCISKFINIIKGSLIYASLTTTPIIILNKEEISFKTYFLSYLLSSIISLLICIFIVGILGHNLIKLYSFPEYMILKKIKVSAFVENIENILASLWYFDLFYLITLSIKRIYEIIKNKFFVFVIVILITLFNAYFLSSNYSYAVIYYENIPIIYLIILIILLLFSKKKLSIST